jgi:hypothetical protein
MSRFRGLKATCGKIPTTVKAAGEISTKPTTIWEFLRVHTLADELDLRTEAEEATSDVGCDYCQNCGGKWIQTMVLRKRRFIFKPCSHCRKPAASSPSGTPVEPGTLDPFVR